MNKKTIVSVISLSILFLTSCSNEQGEVETVMYEVLENGELIVQEPIEENGLDVATKLQLEKELKQMIAEMTGFHEGAIALMISSNHEPSCSIVLPTESLVEHDVIDEIKHQILSKLSKIHGVTIDEESIVITSSNGDVLK